MTERTSIQGCLGMFDTFSYVLTHAVVVAGPEWFQGRLSQDRIRFTTLPFIFELGVQIDVEAYFK